MCPWKYFHISLCVRMLWVCGDCSGCVPPMLRWPLIVNILVLWCRWSVNVVTVHPAINFRTLFCRVSLEAQAKLA